MAQFEYLFRPIKIGPVTVRNRLVNTSHGFPAARRRYLRYLEERARGGVGLIIVPASYGLQSTPVTPARFMPEYLADADALLPSPLTSEGMKFYDETFIPMLREVGEIIHRHGAACFGQMVHTGGSLNNSTWQPLEAPSVVMDRWIAQVPHEMEVERVQELVQAYGQAARRIKAAGLDGVEAHSAHGYLINQFLSPYTNKRTDKYGGSLENRMRFLLEILEAMRANVGPDFPIGIRINCDEFTDGGLTVADMQQIAQVVSDKVAYLNVSGGNRSGFRDGVKMPYTAPSLIPLGPFVPLAAAIKEVVDIPVIVGNRINDPVQAERVLSEGQADMVGMVRALIADPELPNKAREGRLDDIRKCIACNIGCRYTTVVRRGAAQPIACTVNAAAGREDEMELRPAVTRKRVLVVGGGPAGMEAARVAALRGHHPILCEKEAHLGGHVAVIARDPNRQEMGELTRYLELQVRKLRVEVRLGVEVTPELVAELLPDAVVVATGSVPYIPPVPGVTGPNVATAWQALKGEAEVGNRVLIVGGLDGEMNPLFMAAFFADQDKKVEVLSEQLMAGLDSEFVTLHQVLRRLAEKGVAITPMTGVKAIADGRVVVFNTLTKQERAIEGMDTVVLAAGTRANDKLYRALKGTVRELYAVGDCVAPRRPLNAVLEGSRVGRML